MSGVKRWDISRQRIGLATLDEDGIGFLDTPEGLAFLDQMEFIVAPNLMWKASKLGLKYEAGELRSLIVHHLFRPIPGREISVAVRSALAEEPWRYLATCAWNWLHKEEIGMRGISIDYLEEMNLGVMSAGWGDSERELTTLDLVIQKTWEILAARTPLSLAEPLLKLVEWLAHNPPQRLTYEMEEVNAAAHVVRELSRAQITAVVNICWGGRPAQRDTSIMGGYLVDSSFDPVTSDSHLRALRTYSARMRIEQAA